MIMDIRRNDEIKSKIIRQDKRDRELNKGVDLNEVIAYRYEDIIERI